jgi:hypothetical protein
MVGPSSGFDGFNSSGGKLDPTISQPASPVKYKLKWQSLDMEGCGYSQAEKRKQNYQKILLPFPSQEAGTRWN